MKKLIYTGLVLAFMTSCGGGDGSAKGAWSDADKEKFDAEIKKVESSLDAMGDKKQDFIDCYAEKVEANYENFAEANSDVSGCKELATECATEVMGM